MTPLTLPQLLAFAHGLADEARSVVRQHFRNMPEFERKADGTPVSIADRAIERRLRQRIAARFPDHGVLGEEEGPTRLDAEHVWALDPIDGTKAFLAGSPLFGSLIGLLHRGEPVVGVLEAPALGERWAAAKGLGAAHQSRKIRVRQPRPLAECVLGCTTPDPMSADPGFSRLRQQVRWTTYGGDCCAYGFVAMGGIDVLVDRGLKPWDWCALVPIVQEAGGVLLDWNLQPLSLQSEGSVLCASHRDVAAAASAVLTGSN